jgi:hypothetical protein
MLLKIANGAIREGSYPQAWKTSMVIPIPKIKTAKEPLEFKPINILPLFEKVLEIVLQKQILEYLKENSILYDLWCARRRRRLRRLRLLLLRHATLGDDSTGASTCEPQRPPVGWQYPERKGCERK